MINFVFYYTAWLVVLMSLALCALLALALAGMSMSSLAGIALGAWLTNLVMAGALAHKSTKRR